MESNIRKKIIKEIDELSKTVKGCPATLAALQLRLTQLPLYKRTLTMYESKGEMSVYYDHFILTFHIKDDNIIIGDIVSIFDVSDTGFIGSYSIRALHLESSGELD